jgi:hypothetical protein
MVDQVAERPGQVADGCLVPLAADALGLPLGGGGEQALLASEPADDGLHRDPGPRGHLLQGDVVHRLPPEHGHSGVQDPLAGGRGRLGSGGKRPHRRWRAVYDASGGASLTR